MRLRILSIVFALAGLALSFLIVSSASSQTVTDDYGGRPPQFTPVASPTDFPSTPVVGPPTPALGKPTNGRPAFNPVQFFGMNLYLTGLERSDQQAQTLGTMAAQAGVKWSREELSWANIETYQKGQFNWGTYDRRLSYDAVNNIQVIGMLLTTPRWASTNPDVADYYWYEPINFNDYYDYVRAAVNRWKGQIHTWEIWNEPNHPGTWNCVNSCDRAADYARLLQGAYVTIKSVDPNARVLIGGLYVHDYNNEGMAFLNQVVTDSGGAINFDGMSIHTYMPDRVPEAERPDSVVQNFQYRLNMVNDWINAHGGRPGEIWITEEGKSTCTGCQYPWTEDQQASMLARMYGIAAASPRVVQFDYFQFEDKFNNPADLWGGMSIVRDDLSPKPAYYTYAVAAGMLEGSTYTGMGPQMIPGNNPNQPDSSDYVGFDYRFLRGGLPMHMVWRVNDSATVNYPVEGTQVDVVDRDGTSTRRTATNGYISLTISPRPQYIQTVSCGSRFTDVCPDYWAYTYIDYLAQHGIISGYGDGTFRPGGIATRAQLSKMVTLSRGWAIYTPPAPSFRDVPASNPFYGYIETARYHGAISGYTCGANCLEFRPNNNVTRGQITKMIVAAFGWAINTAGGPHFRDVPTNDTFYPYVETAFNHNVISGYSDGTFRPGYAVTRAQLSKMLYQAINQ